MERHYFDHNATTPIDPQVLDAMMPALREVSGTASSIHSYGQDARRLVEVARLQVAESQPYQRRGLSVAIRRVHAHFPRRRAQPL